VLAERSLRPPSHAELPLMPLAISDIGRALPRVLSEIPRKHEPKPHARTAAEQLADLSVGAPHQFAALSQVVPQAAAAALLLEAPPLLVVALCLPVTALRALSALRATAALSLPSARLVTAAPAAVPVLVVVAGQVGRCNSPHP